MKIVIAGAMLSLLLIGPAAWAQSRPVEGSVVPTSEPSSVEFTAGLAGGAGKTGAVLGGTGVIGLGERFAVELGGAWLDRGDASHALAANANLRIRLISGGRLLPYAVVGAGVYHARFDLDQMFGPMAGRFAPGTMMQPIGGGQAGFGMMGPGYGGYTPGQGFGPGYGAYVGGTFTPPHLPGFYANRFGDVRVPADGHWGTRSFTDPSLTLGGGLRVDVTDRLFVRPDARALVVIGNGHANTLGLFSLGLGVTF